MFNPSVDGKKSCSAIDGGLVMKNPTTTIVTHVLHNKCDFPSVNDIEDLSVSFYLIFISGLDSIFVSLASILALSALFSSICMNVTLFPYSVARFHVTVIGICFSVIELIFNLNLIVFSTSATVKSHCYFVAVSFLPHRSPLLAAPLKLLNNGYPSRSRLPPILISHHLIAKSTSAAGEGREVEMSPNFDSISKSLKRKQTLKLVMVFGYDSARFQCSYHRTGNSDSIRFLFHGSVFWDVLSSLQLESGEALECSWIAIAIFGTFLYSQVTAKKGKAPEVGKKDGK
ncbi:Probable inactive patatin-like protein 9 [Linum perenne]